MIECELTDDKVLTVYTDDGMAIRYLKNLKNVTAEYFTDWNAFAQDREPIGYSWNFNAGPAMLDKLVNKFGTLLKVHRTNQ